MNLHKFRLTSHLTNSSSLLLAAMTLLFTAGVAKPAHAQPDSPTTDSRPNILWITYEDAGPQLGCYGDKYAVSPNIDALATSGCVYTHVWSTAPVCSPARTAILTGMYPSTTGGIHHRSQVPIPSDVPLYPQLLRAAGYYCTNNSKTDYDVATPRALWDESSPRAHWKNRPAGKPFFAVFNLNVCHEGQFRMRKGKTVHDPAKAPIPAYMPDTPEVRLDWARYYDSLTDMDKQAGDLIREMRDAGVADNTIIVVGADNGIGMPRSKRSVQDSGLHVSLVVYLPPAHAGVAPPDYKIGGKSERLVSFVDMAPTWLRLAGQDVPARMQGHPFLGKGAPPTSPDCMFGERGRMDERYDISRSATDGRYVYIRNFLPYLPPGQHVQYMFQWPTTRVWHDLFTSGSLNEAQSAFWKPKPAEELYDLQSDPWEVKNLAQATGDSGTAMKKLRAALQEHQLIARDLGLLPESEMLRLGSDKTPYAWARDLKEEGVKEIISTAWAASSMADADLAPCQAATRSTLSPLRWWGVMGLLMRGRSAVEANAGALRERLADESPAVRVAAAEALATFGAATDEGPAMDELVKLAATGTPGAVRLEAANAISRVGAAAEPYKPKLQALVQSAPVPKGKKEREADSQVGTVLNALIHSGSAAGESAGAGSTSE
jgi:uncharacterized sulfatase